MGSHLANLYARWRAQGPDDDPDPYDLLEAEMLQHDPQSAQDAATMLDVVAVCVSGGGRSDGLDVLAIEVVADWLHCLAGSSERQAA